MPVFQIYFLFSEANSQFMLAWLSLAEKLTNSQQITESTYQYVESTGTTGFNADQHLAIIHKVICWEKLFKSILM